jgi:hypothetical protein
MEERDTILQKLKKSLKDKYAIAEKYYSILSVVNNLNLTKREIELVAYIAIHGTISYANRRTEFCNKYNTTSATISNLICRLKKVNVLIKEFGKIKVNPIIVIDFTKNLNLVIIIEHNGETKQDVAKGLVNKEDVNKVSDIRKGNNSGDSAPV